MDAEPLQTVVGRPGVPSATERPQDDGAPAVRRPRNEAEGKKPRRFLLSSRSESDGPTTDVGVLQPLRGFVDDSDLRLLNLFKPRTKTRSRLNL